MVELYILTGVILTVLAILFVPNWLDDKEHPAALFAICVIVTVLWAPMLAVAFALFMKRSWHTWRLIFRLLKQRWFP
jgi:hypothetical protein